MNRWLLAALCIAAFCVAGCSKGGGSSGAPDPGQVRIVNLVPTSPALQTSLTGTQVANVSYGQASPLTSEAANTYDLLVHYLDPTLGNTVTVLENSSFAVTSDKESTVFLTGSLESATATVVTNDKTGDIVSGNTEIQFFNGNSKVGAVDVYLSDDATSTSINGITPISLDVNAWSDLTTIASGDHRILVTAAGDPTVIYDSGKVTLASQTRRMFAVTDYFGPGGNIRTVEINTRSSSTLVDEQFPTAVRVANMIADLSSVDIVRDGAVMVSGLQFGKLSDYVEFDPGQNDFQVTLAGDPSSVIYDNTRQTVPGERRTLVITGTGTTSNVQGRFVLDDARRIETGAQVRVINASPGAGNLDAYFLVPGQALTDATATFSNFTLLTNGATLLEGRQFDVVFTRAGEDTVVLGPERVTLANSGIYSIFIRDATGGGTPSEIVLADDFAL